MYLIGDGETRLQGIPISAGKVVSRVCLFNDRRHAGMEINGRQPVVPAKELADLQDAVRKALLRLQQLEQEVAGRIGRAEAGIFAAQAMILQDAAVMDRIQTAIRAGSSAPQAVIRVMDEYETRLLELDNEYIRERASDIGEIKRRVLDILGNVRPTLKCAGMSHCRKGRDRLVVAAELTPTLTLELDTRHVRGFITERGGKTSHAAILARALGIPAVTGLRGIHQALSCGTELLVDGDTGMVVVWPNAETVREFLGQDANRGAAAAAPSAPVANLRVLANITTAADAQEARAARAEGIGLYRTEFEFFAANRILDEEQQYRRYAAVIRMMRGAPVTCRLLDVGGDKSAEFLNIQPEQNPYLGLRGGRLLQARPELWREQARALARASAHGPVNVLYPMIVDVEQFNALRAMFDDAVAGLPPGQLAHGVMLEVPSACLQARELLAVADFASVGTNDLIQYLFAVDRNNEQVSYDYRPDRQVFWRLLADMAGIARELGKPLTVCGELAGEPDYVARMLRSGVAAVSVSPRMIGAVRRAAGAGAGPADGA